ncbi:MAG: diguanylate cyclase domain-containing protein [Rhodoblastus sp.]
MNTAAVRRSIYAKFILVFAVALVLATTLGGILIAHERQVSAQAQQAARVGGLIGRVASMIAAAGYPDDPKGAQSLLSLLLFDRAIVCAEIVDGNGVATGVSAPARVGCRGEPAQKTATAPIPDTGFDLRVMVSGEELVEVRNDAIWSVFILSVMAVGYATVAAYAVFRRVVGAPISEILFSIRHFTQTGAHRTIEYAARDELGDVIKAFNTMQTNLERESIALKEANDLLRRAAETDALTGLANRAALAVRAGRYSAGDLPPLAAALLIDVDSFKQINDRLGHAAGDDVLRQTALRLQEAAGAAAFVTRLGGDEFVVLFDGADGQMNFAAAMARIEAAFLAPMAVAGRRLVVGLSIGAILADEAETDVDRLIARADRQMYEVKRLRKQNALNAPARADGERAA